MGKSSKYPNYATGSVTINGKTVATTTKDKNGTISSNYNMTGTEKNMYNNIQKNLNSSISNLFNITDANKKEWNEQLNTYKQQGIDEINNIYTPMETNLKNDIASRFGNLDNSIFLDKLSNITDNKAKAVSNLSDNLLLKQDQLYSTEIQNRINYISLLSSLESGMTNKMFSYINQARQNTESGNNYNSQAYNSTSSGGGGLLGMNFGSSIASAASYLGKSHPNVAAGLSAMSFL